MSKTKILVAAIAGAAMLSAAGVASAAANGFYAGAEGGWTHLDYSKSDVNYHGNANVNASVKKNGFGGRPFVGYQINQNIAVETGYTIYGNQTFKNVTVNGVGAPNITVKQEAWDAFAKGILPIADGFNVYGKAGAAYVWSKASASGYSDSIHKFRPAAGIGAGYDINQNVTANVFWTRVFSGSGIANSDLAGVGLSYHFG